MYSTLEFSVGDGTGSKEGLEFSIGDGTDSKEGLERCKHKETL